MNKLLLPILIILGLPLVFQSTPTEILKLKIFDAFVQTPEPSGYFTILNITEEDIDAEGGWPIPRQRLGNIHAELIEKGALGVGWVISFPHPDRFGGDRFFAESLKYGTSILASFEYPNQIYPKTVGTVIKGPDVGGMLAKGVVQNTHNLRSDYIQEGISAAPTDLDNLVRRIPLLFKTPDGYVSSFGTEVLKSLAGAKTYIIKTNELGIEEITVQGLPPVKTDSLGRKWISWVGTSETNLQEMNVEGKFVFLGITAPGIMPQVATPAGLLEPHKIQAALSESILIQNSPRIPEWSLAAEILIFGIFVSLTWLTINYLGVVKGLSIATILLFTTGFSGVFSIQKGILLDFSWTFISQIITSTVAFYINYKKQYKLRQQIKKQFEHYLDPRQVKQLQDNPELLKLGGEKKYCTFLFTDVRGFTSLSEKLDPEEVTDIMNRVLTEQVNCIQAHGGMVDKFIGDACMAIFNAPLCIDDHEKRAVACAQDMHTAIRMLQKELPEPIAIGIGVNSGEAVVGNMGSNTRFDYSAIGDAVNTAARLESATKEAGVDILIGEATIKKTQNGVFHKKIYVKGKKKPLKVYTI
jgi:adenylate cyclase